MLPSVSVLEAVASGQPIGLIFKDATGSAGGGFGLLFLLLGIMMFAGIGALTASSRCTYAFARDGAIPGYSLWRRVNHRLDVPVWAVILSALVDALLGLIYFGSSAAFNSFTGVATICLAASYGVPVLISVVRRREAVRHSTFSLGNALGYTVNLIALAWIVLSIALFCMPYTLPVTASSMNYASVVFMGFASISISWYFVQRKKFTGPPVPRDEIHEGVGISDYRKESTAAEEAGAGIGSERGEEMGEKIVGKT